jgi:hypothetical protein
MFLTFLISISFFVVSFADNARVYILTPEHPYRLVTLAGVERVRRDTCAGQFTERAFTEVLQGPLDTVTYERPGDPTSPAYLWRAGKLVNAELLRRGYAYPTPNLDRLAHGKLLSQAASRARLERRGVWAPCER